MTNKGIDGRFICLYLNISLLMKKNLLIWSTLVLLLGSCQKDELTPTVSSQVTPTSSANARVKADLVTPQDDTGISRGTVQFQWAGNTASQSWQSADPMTTSQRIAILDAAFAKISQSRDRTNFQCAYDRAKADIQAGKRFPAGNPSYNFVKNCCRTCAEDLGDVNGARCDFQVNKGIF